MTKTERAEYQRKWREKNREHFNEYSRRYRRLNPVPSREQVKKWKKNNPDKHVKMVDVDNNFYPKIKAIPKLLDKTQKYLAIVESSPLWLVNSTDDTHTPNAIQRLKDVAADLLNESVGWCAEDLYEFGNAIISAIREIEK